MPSRDPVCPVLKDQKFDADPIAPAENVIEHLNHSVGSGRRILLTGPRFSGRSSTLQAWLAQAKKIDFAVFHATGLTPDRDHPAGVIYGLIAAIRAHVGAVDAIPLDESGLREALPNWLARLSGQPAVIIIDDIDLISGSDLTGEPDWLPPYLPPGLTLIASAEPGLLAERLRQLGWEGIDMNRGAQQDRERIEATLEQAAQNPASREALRFLALVPEGLAAEQLESLGAQSTDLPHDLLAVAGADNRYRLSHPGIRAATQRKLISGSAEARRLHALLADEMPTPLLRARSLAKANEWTALLEMLAEMDSLILWRDDPFAWQSLWADLPARDTAISHLFQQLETLRNTPATQATDSLAMAHANAARILDHLDAHDAAASVRLAAHTQLAHRAPNTLASARAAHHYAAVDLVESNPAQAAALLQTAFNVRQQALGDDHPDTRSTRHGLAAAWEAAGELDKAIAEYAGLLATREATLGREHSALIPLLGNLGAAQRAANYLERARGPFERAVKIAEAASTGPSPALAVALDNLASLLYAGQDHAGAEARYRQALDVTQSLFGPGHPATAAAIHNLGTVLDAREQFNEAARCYRQAVEIRTQALGREHAETATSLHNLAGVLDVTGQREEAETLYREAIGIWEAVVGDAHPATATSINNLADLLRENGRLDEAQPLYEENLQRWQTLYGGDHPNTVMTAAELGGLHADAGRIQQAEPMLREAVQKLERIMGVDSTLHIDSLCRLAALLRTQGRAAEGVVLLEAAYEKAAGTTRILSPRLQKLRRHLDGLRKAVKGTDT